MDKPAKTTIVLPEKAPQDIPPEIFDRISKILKTLRGFNLDYYKDKCIRRRINIRIRATHSSSAEAYCDLLLTNEAELDLLLKVLTIHVTQFFRNPQTFEKLKQEIFPELFLRCGQRGHNGLRIWSVGCASGEEPYSLALILKDSFSDEMKDCSVSILATDVDQGTLDVARAAVYNEDRLEELPAPLKGRYFDHRGTKYHLAPEIKEMVTFRHSDLQDVSSYEVSDLVLCRNVLIYFERAQQDKIIEGFANVLHRGGILVLGKSETLFGSSRQRFRTVCPVERIYQAL